MMKRNKVIYNTTMLYLLNIAKIVFPFFTLPYLTRVLSVEGYAAVTYVKSVMAYLQLIVDFGFMLSATKSIVEAHGDKAKIGRITVNVIAGKLILSSGCFLILIVLNSSIEILKNNLVFSYLSFLSIVFNIFLLDFLFRGIEQMGVITLRFVIARGISTILTFFAIKSDQDLIWIPLLEIMGAVVSVFLVFYQKKQYGISLKITYLDWRQLIELMKTSAVYFVSNIVSTALGALNTFIIGIYLDSASIAYWGVVMQILSAIQILYNPISDGIYPEMVKTKNLKLIKNILLIFMPLISFGCFILFCFSEFALFVVGGEKYIQAKSILQLCVPVLWFSFPTFILGWPGLGAIGKVRENTKSTVYGCVFQVLGLVVLVLTNNFNLVNIAILRSASEFMLFISRTYYFIKFKDKFCVKGA